VEAAAASISAEDIHERVAFLASDELLGRATPSPGLDTAAAYLVREYERLGLSPAGEDDSYLQRYPLRTLGLDTATVHFGHILADGTGNEMLTYGSDFFVLPGGSREGLEMNHAHLVWAGTAVPGALPRADYEDTAPIVGVPGPPGQAWQQAIVRAREAAREAGATALVVVTDASMPGELFERMADQSWRSESRTIRTPDPDQIAVFVLRRHAFDAIAAREGFDAAAAPAGAVPFERVGAHFAARLEVREEARPPNVVAMIRGSDPALAGEYVVLSAHFD